jgi:hypothetical protein
MRPAHRYLKPQWAAQPMPVANVHRSIGIGVRLVSAPRADIGMFLSFIQGTRRFKLEVQP